MTNMYDESLTYDKNGNIQSLHRNGDFDSDIYAPIQIDDLVYEYDTNKKNQLLKVTDYSNSPKGFKDNSGSTGPYEEGATIPGDDYTYDANGNMTSDLNKGITAITYNHLTSGANNFWFGKQYCVSLRCQRQKVEEKSNGWQ